MLKLTALLVGLAAGAVVQAADPNYHVVKEIQIGGDGGWDYLILDPATHRLYVSHATKIVVVDTETGRVVGEIPDAAGVHGFAIAPRWCVAHRTGRGSCGMLDSGSLRS
jgi:hypothetical protein